MADKKLPFFQKILAFIFAVLVAASVVFFGYRIAMKPSYKAHEIEQCRLLAVSSLAAIAEKTADDPQMWDKFPEETIYLIIDHKTMPDNWVIKLEAKKSGRMLKLKSAATSGWNSRSPQEAVFTASIDRDADTQNITYDDESASLIADKIAAALPSTKKEGLKYILPDERKVTPVDIIADVHHYMNKKFIIIRPAH